MNPRDSYRYRPRRTVLTAPTTGLWQGFGDETDAEMWRTLEAELRQREESRREAKRNDAMMAQYFAEFTR